MRVRAGWGIWGPAILELISSRRPEVDVGAAAETEAAGRSEWGRGGQFVVKPARPVPGRSQREVGTPETRGLTEKVRYATADGPRG